MSDSEHVVPNRIESLHVKGFRSLADIQLDNIPSPMVLLGANGAGKSNLLSAFEMLKSVFAMELHRFVAHRGGAGDQLFGGSKVTPRMELDVRFRTHEGPNTYSLVLEGTGTDEMTFAREEFRYWGLPTGSGQRAGALHYGPYASGRESGFALIACSKEGDFRSKAAVNLLRDCMVYQFHDTSSTSRLKVRWDAEDGHRLLEHGGNLAPVLILLREHDLPRYRLICRHIRRVLPEFDDFELDVEYGKTLLRWRAKSTGQTIGAHLTSDGTLRAFCLITLLNLPDELLPNIILLDEPELGLHPFAVSLVSHMAKVMARERQVIVATQSPYFVDAFSLDEIVVLTMRDGKTHTKRFADGDFSHWLEEHTTGELWWMNLLGGYP